MSFLYATLPPYLYRGQRHIMVCINIEYGLEPVDKPGSVVGNHSSGTCVTTCLKRPTRIPYGPYVRTLQSNGFLFGLAPSGVFPATTVTNRAVRSYRTISPLPTIPKGKVGGIFSVALSVGSHLPGVTWHSALWSPDFPPLAVRQRAIA